MNKRIFSAAFFLFLIVTFSFGQKPGTVFPPGEAGRDYNVTDSKGKRQGTWIRVYKTNPKILYYKGQFKDGVPQGVFDFYFETGEQMSTVNHVQDTTINDVVNYNPDGKTKMSEGRYVGKVIEKKWTRQKQDKWILYDAVGNKVADEEYIDDQLNGTCRYYYSNGKLLKEATFKNGIEEGPFLEYFEDGTKKSEGAYKLGEFDGPYKLYYPSGQPKMQGQYAKGSMNGLFLYFLQSGRIELNVKYQMGKEIARRYENGTFVEYYPGGIPKSEYTYEDGKKNGPFTEWYDKGQFENVPPTQEDMDMGIPLRQKLMGTQIKIQGDYMDDHLEGEIRYFSEDGRLEKTENRVNGKLEKSE